MYGNTIVDGFMSFTDAVKDKLGLLTPKEIGKRASSAMLDEVEAAQKTLRGQTEAASAQRGGKPEAR